MALYSVSAKTTFVYPGPAWELKAGASRRPRILELGINVALGTTANPCYIGWSSSPGTQSSPVSLLAENPDDPASVCTVAVAWSVNPSVPSTFLRVWCPSSSIKECILWTFPEGIPISSSFSLILWNTVLAGGASYNVHVVVDE